MFIRFGSGTFFDKVVGDDAKMRFKGCSGDDEGLQPTPSTENMEEAMVKQFNKTEQRDEHVMALWDPSRKNFHARSQRRLYFMSEMSHLFCSMKKDENLYKKNVFFTYWNSISFSCRHSSATRREPSSLKIHIFSHFSFIYLIFQYLYRSQQFTHNFHTILMTQIHELTIKRIRNFIALKFHTLCSRVFLTHHCAH